MGEHHDVLAEPPQDGVVRPESRADRVDDDMVVLAEAGGPVGRPSLVDMMVAALEGDGGREEDDGSMAGQGRDERRRCGLRQVLANFQADDQVEAVAEVEVSLQVDLCHAFRVDFEQGFIEPGAIDAADLADAEPACHGEPGTEPTADIEYGRWAVDAEHGGEDRQGGMVVGVALVVELAMVEVVVEKIPVVAVVLACDFGHDDPAWRWRTAGRRGARVVPATGWPLVKTARWR